MHRRYVQGTLVGLTLAAGAAASAMGCGAVPDIRFVEDDAQADASRSDGTTDSATVDSAPGPCSSQPPVPSATCCGQVWCVGNCGGANCAACESTSCGSAEVCCGRPQGVLCKKGACN